MRKYLDTSFAIIACAVLSALCLLISCGIDGEWWPLFNLLFYALILLPPALGSLDDTGLFGTMSDFFAAVFTFSLFAFPIVLYRAEVINGAALFFAFTSNVLSCAEFIDTLKDYDKRSLREPLDFGSFEAYCKERFCEEELKFVLEVHNFRKIKDESALRKKGEEILTQYVKSDGEFQVNLPYHLQQELLQQSGKLGRTAFDEASMEIQHVMQADLWMEYIRTHTLNARLSMARDIAFDWIKDPKKICSAEFFSFPNPVNVLDSRIHNLLASLASILLLLLQYFAGVSPLYIGIYLSYGYIVRGLCGPRLDVQGWLVLFVLQPLVDGIKLGPFQLTSRFVPGPPRRFVQLVGGSMATTALVLNSLRLSGIGNISHWIPTTLYIVLASVAMVAFVFNKCAGCYMFKILMKFGCVPKKTCEQCYMAINDNRHKTKVLPDSVEAMF